MSALTNSNCRKAFFVMVIVLSLAAGASAQATWSPIVTVGSGYVDCSARQVVRTSGETVYVITNASGFSGGTAPSSVRVYKGSPSGNPTSFSEMDAAHRPGNGVRIGGVEAKLAGSDRFIQIVYEDIEVSQTKYMKFDTVTDTWGAPEIVGALNGQNRTERYMGKTGMALDSNGMPHVITGGLNEPMYYTNRVGGSWSTPILVANSSAYMHPSSAFDRNGVLHVAYYDGSSTMFYRQRDPASGNWSPVETITANASTSQADESPSLVIDSSGRILVNYIAGDGSFRYKLARRNAANSWTDISPGPEVAGHAPGVYIDNNDNIFALEGHDLSIIQPSVEVRSAAGVWGSYSNLASGPPTRDGSSSSRWDLLWPGNTAHLDEAMMDEAGVDSSGSHYAITYYLHASLNSTPDTTPPTVSMSTPANGATVSGVVGVSASASDNVGVAGVQFQLDGANLGAEVTSAPYQISWNTTTVANGSHSLTAKARDASGNSTTNAAVSITVNNTDTTPPTVAITSPANGATVSATVTVTANASDNVGVVGVQFQLDGANLGAGITSAPYQIAWNTAAIANGSHSLTAKARDASGNSTTSAAVSVTVSNSALPPPGGLMAAYGFNEGTGTITHDASGNNNNGTLASVQWSSAGRYGTAVSFNGTSSLITIADSPSLDLTTAVTLEVWVNPSAAPQGWQAVIFKEMPSDGAYFLYRSGYSAAPVVGIFSGAEREIVGASGLALNTWTHLAFTYDGAMERLYVNGVQVASQAQTGAIQTSSGALHIGGDSVWGEHYQGLIDEVRIYNRALSAAEIQTDINTPISGAPPADTTPPTVAITAPANGATVSATQTVTANASDNVGVAGVQFQLDGANLGAEITSAPYQISWNTTAVANGPHSLTAKARDAAGNSTTSATVTVTVNNADTTPPTVSITAPANGATVSATVTVSASASDNVGVAGVQFQLDGANLGPEITSAPYQISWNTTTVANGSHSLTAKARDAAGNSTTTATVTVTVNNADATPPTVSITAPANGATVSATVTVTANASDNVGVAGVQFQLDGANLGAEVTSAPYQISWNTTTAANGPHSLTVKARDAAGNSTTSANVSVTVNNSDTTPPTVSITAPVNGATVSATVTVSASASDNVGVAGVQFQLDGANLGAEVTSAPYQVSWNTTSVTNGSHSLVAKVRDAAGNSTTSAAVTVTISNSALPPPGGLMAAYGFNEGTGTTTHDASGNNNNGSLSSVQWSSAGRYGNAVSFNGTSSLITIADSPSLDLTTAVTLEAWVNPSAAPQGWQAVIFKEMPSDGAYFLYRSGYSAAPIVGIFSSAEREIVGTSGLALNTWTHLAFTYDGAMERLYVNGVQVASQAQTGAIQTSSGALHIGGDSVWGEHYQGLIDEVRIYNRALSASEIQTDMSSPI